MCELILTSNAEKDLQRLDPELRRQILENLNGSVKIVTALFINP